MYGITLSQSVEKGFYAAAATTSLYLLFSAKKVNDIFIEASVNFIGIALANYSIKNIKFFDEWTDKSKTIAIFSIAFLTSITIRYGASKYYKESLNANQFIRQTASDWVLAYLFNAGKYIA